MGCPINGDYHDYSLTCQDCATALAVLYTRYEPNTVTYSFSAEGRDWDNDGITPLPITKEMSFQEASRLTHNNRFTMTNCSLPMMHAMEKNMEIDVFMVLTDNQTNSGSVHPSKALEMYRKSSKILDAKLIVLAMCSNEFSIGDPADPNMLDVVGFDTATPDVISSFVGL